ncbi:MAG: enoyl-CoA hydratase/isomerase family protein [Planctomycetota bacterium]|jgi:enoyl-CoA hydratase/carnithine racemase
MSTEPVLVEITPPVAHITLNDPDRRNAMTIAMFDALDAALGRVAGADDVRVAILGGRGRVFCAGFDLAAAVEDRGLMARFIERLSRLNRGLRRLPQPVVAAVRGAAIAGGCAATSACDLVCASATTRFGYPVHPIGVSPGVTIPTLSQAIGAGAARALLMEGRLIDGVEAHRRGLVSHLVDTDDDVAGEVDALARRLAGHGPVAMRATKAWLNELDGSLDDARFDGCAAGTAAAAGTDESVALLHAFWKRRAEGR